MNFALTFVNLFQAKPWKYSENYNECDRALENLKFSRKKEDSLGCLETVLKFLFFSYKIEEQWLMPVFLSGQEIGSQG